MGDSIPLGYSPVNNHILCLFTHATTLTCWMFHMELTTFLIPPAATTLILVVPIIFYVDLTITTLSFLMWHIPWGVPPPSSSGILVLVCVLGLLALSLSYTHPITSPKYSTKLVLMLTAPQLWLLAKNRLKKMLIKL